MQMSSCDFWVVGIKIKERYHPTQSDDAYQGVIDMKFGVGQAALRKEDVRFLKGNRSVYRRYSARGLSLLPCFTLTRSACSSDIAGRDKGANRARRPGPLYVGRHRRPAASQSPAVCRLSPWAGQKFPPVSQPHVAKDRLRYVGQPIAFVVADTLDKARDAAEMIEFDFDELPVVVDAKAAVNDGAAPAARRGARQYLL